MNSKAVTCASDLVELAHAITHETRRAIRMSKDITVSLTQARVLGVTDRQRGISVSEVAAQIGLGFSATSIMIDGLVRRGLLTRHRAVDDRRRMVLTPSRKGEALLRQVRQLSARHTAAFIADLPSAELAAITRIATTLRLLIASSARGTAQPGAAHV